VREEAVEWFAAGGLAVVVASLVALLRSAREPGPFPRRRRPLVGRMIPMPRRPVDTVPPTILDLTTVEDQRRVG
jgi:hypothetical protein